MEITIIHDEHLSSAVYQTEKAMNQLHFHYKENGKNRRLAFAYKLLYYAWRIICKEDSKAVVREVVYETEF